MKLTITKISYPLTTTFFITGYEFTHSDTIQIALEEDGHIGRGEGLGAYYQGEAQDSMIAQLEAVRAAIEAGVDQDAIQALLPTGGARNALDCALWDLQAKKSAVAVWDRLNMTPKTLVSVATVGVDTPENMAIAAQNLSIYSYLKIKLSGDDPIARLEAIRKARPDAKMIVDVNQGWSFEELKEYTPAAEKLGIAMIEQPLARGGDEALEGYKSSVPLGADESCLNVAEYEVAASRYDVINIKLDKCGGLTEGLKLVELAKRDGKGLMVGNMTGTSLSMAPAYVIGQFCQFVDIDGPLFFKQDIENALTYSDGGLVSIPTRELWG